MEMSNFYYLKVKSHGEQAAGKENRVFSSIKKHNKRFKSHVHLMTAYASTNRTNFECVALFL